MYHRLATRFGNRSVVRSNEPLDNDALRAIVPSIFADEAHESRSARYVYVPTIELVDRLRTEGFQPFFAAQARPRDDARKDHTKHMLRLRRTGDIRATEAAEVIIVNSHDGTSAYQMFAGMIRFVCTNSLITGDRFEEVRVPHKGNIGDQIIEGAYTIAKDFPRLIDAAAEMKATTLTPAAEQGVFARAALVARYGEEDESPIRHDQVLTPRRREDVDGSIWGTLNIAQENIIRGGLQGRKADANGRVRRSTTRPINGIDQNVTLNRAMWTLAEGMRAIKQAA